MTDFAGIFYEYGISNQFPGWKGGYGPVDFRATHFFHPGGNELLLVRKFHAGNPKRASEITIVTRPRR